MGWFDFIYKKNSKYKDELIDQLSEEIKFWQSKAKEPKVEWQNPYNWSNAPNNYETISGVKFPVNSCIAPQDKELQRFAKVLKRDNIKDTAEAIELFLSQKIKYSYDKDNNFHKGFIEWWQPASMTWALKEGDCDDMALLFQTFMHICGYGKESVCAASLDLKVVWFNKKPVGHAFNYVLIDDIWVVYDANAGERKDEVTYPKLEECTFWCNFWGVYC